MCRSSGLLVGKLNQVLFYQHTPPSTFTCHKLPFEGHSLPTYAVLKQCYIIILVCIVQVLWLHPYHIAHQTNISWQHSVLIDCIQPSLIRFIILTFV